MPKAMSEVHDAGHHENYPRPRCPGCAPRIADMKSKARRLQVGDILTYSWGYDQTNVDAFQVVRASDGCVWLREIATRVTETTGWMAERVVPVRDAFLKDSPEIKKVRKLNLWAYRDADLEEYVQMDHGSGRLWLGNSLYCSHYA